MMLWRYLYCSIAWIVHNLKLCRVSLDADFPGELLLNDIKYTQGHRKKLESGEPRHGVISISIHAGGIV